MDDHLVQDQCHGRAQERDHHILLPAVAMRPGAWPKPEERQGADEQIAPSAAGKHADVIDHRVMARKAIDGCEQGIIHTWSPRFEAGEHSRAASLSSAVSARASTKSLTIDPPTSPGFLAQTGHSARPAWATQAG